MQGGYAGKLLRIDLTAQTSSIEPLPEKIARQYIGGAGIAIKYLLDEVPGDVDALGSQNNLYFATGPLTGSDAPCSSRMSVVAKSPLTGAVAMSSTGGHFPAELKFAGYDMVIVEGKSETPVFIVINNDKVTFRNAKSLWGSNTFDCQQLIKDKLNDQNYRVCCIGQAGENLSLMASIINERHAAGRKGVGAVMGSKNLKAIAVRGSNNVKIADEAKFKEARKFMLDTMKASPMLYAHFAKTGTSTMVDVIHASGIFPVKNFSATGEWDCISDLGSETSVEYNVTNEYCYKCPVGCSQVKIAKNAPYTGALSIPEFEAMYSFGGATMVKSVDSIIAADRLCDEYGIDNMSVGLTIAFAMELTEKGIITKDDTDGIDLRFGNDEAMVAFIKKIAFREGFGDILADGSRKAAAKIGKGAEKYSQHVKGLELPGYDPRGVKAHGLNYATAYTGADHNRGYAFQEVFSIPIPYAVDRFEYEGKGKLTKWNQDVRSACCDNAPMCAFLIDMAVTAVAEQNTAALVNAITGFDLTVEEVYQAGERTNNTAKLFNIKAGFTRADDTLPERFFTETLKDGSAKGQVVSQEGFNLMLEEYYEARKWSKDGVPTAEKLRELDLL